jgi:hypothetical protein
MYPFNGQTSVMPGSTANLTEPRSGLAIFVLNQFTPHIQPPTNLLSIQRRRSRLLSNRVLLVPKSVHVDVDTITFTGWTPETTPTHVPEGYTVYDLHFW